MAEHLKQTFSVLGRVWCRTMHRKPMWPIHGEYHCSVCLRRYPVPWETEPEGPEVETVSHARSKAPQIA